MKNLILAISLLVANTIAKPTETDWRQQAGNDWRTSCIWRDESVPGGSGYAALSYA